MMSLYYLKALQGEEPYASWYGLSRAEIKPFHPERVPPDCPHDCMSCSKSLFGECGFFDEDDDDGDIDEGFTPARRKIH